MPCASGRSAELAWMETNRSAALRVGDRCALLQRDKHIGVAGQRHTPLRILLHQVSQPFGDVEDDILLHESRRANRPRIFAAVPRVDDDMPAGHGRDEMRLRCALEGWRGRDSVAPALLSVDAGETARGRGWTGGTRRVASSFDIDDQAIRIASW